MEQIRDLWSQELSAVLLKDYMWECPIDKPIDVVFTNQRIFAIPGSGFSALESIERNSNRTMYAMALGGVPAAIFAPKAAAAWERFRERRQAKKLTIDDLLELESMNLAIVAKIEELTWEVEEQKRVWFTKKHSNIICFGSLSFAKKSLRGALFLHRDLPANEVALGLKNTLGITPIVTDYTKRPPLDKLDQYWVDRVLKSE